MMQGLNVKMLFYGTLNLRLGGAKPINDCRKCPMISLIFDQIVGEQLLTMRIGI